MEGIDEAVRAEGAAKKMRALWEKKARYAKKEGAYKGREVAAIQRKGMPAMQRKGASARLPGGNAVCYTENKNGETESMGG